MLFLEKIRDVSPVDFVRSYSCVRGGNRAFVMGASSANWMEPAVPGATWRVSASWREGFEGRSGFGGGFISVEVQLSSKMFCSG